MYYANYDENTGEILGFYVDGIHEVIPSPNIELTEEQWQQAVMGTYRVIDGALQEYLPNEELTTEQKIAKFQKKYSLKLNSVREQFALAEVTGNEQNISRLKSEYADLLAEFRRGVEGLYAGDEPLEAEDNYGNTPGGYCEFCGEALTYGVCNNCKWEKIEG